MPAQRIRFFFGRESSLFSSFSSSLVARIPASLDSYKYRNRGMGIRSNRSVRSARTKAFRGSRASLKVATTRSVAARELIPGINFSRANTESFRRRNSSSFLFLSVVFSLKHGLVVPALISRPDRHTSSGDQSDILGTHSRSGQCPHLYAYYSR